LFLLIDWPGTFVLMMVEAIAYRTPVVADRRGSIPEVIEEGITGFILDGREAARRPAEHIPTLNPTHRRRPFEPRFDVRRMAEGYLTVHQRPIESRLTLTYAK
jgi:glycosyltransferase involved in cell wall biosynthesis